MVVKAFVKSPQQRLSTLGDGVESDSARCPFDMGTTPPNERLRESVAVTNTLPIKTSN